MPKFTANPERFDPYKNFAFVVVIDNQPVAGLSKCSALKRTTEVATWYEAGDANREHQSPTRTKNEPITLEAGVTHDLTFENWANLVHNFRSEATASLKDFRKNIRIEFHNEAGQLAIAYNVFRCWVSEYQSLPDLDAAGTAIAITHIKIQNEGWERDLAVTEPVET